MHRDRALCTRHPTTARHPPPPPPMLPGLNPGSTPAVDSRSVFTRRSGAVVKNATGAVVKKGSGTVVKSSTINPQQPTNPRHWHPPPPLPKLTKEQRESLELKKRTLELKRIAAGVARLPPPNCSNPAPPAPAHKFPVRNPDIQRPPAPTAQPDLGGKNSRAEIKRKKKEAKIRKRFPDLPLEEARLKFSAEKRKAKAARKQEERERSDATHHGPKTRSQQRKRPENRRPPVPAPRRGARNEWKYELVPSQSLRDEITAMVKAKANDPLVEVRTTLAALKGLNPF